MNAQQEILEMFLPKGVFEHFDLVEGKIIDENNIKIVLEEKDIPPTDEDNPNQEIIGKKFHDITITDFPIRGRRTLLTFRRRYWKVKGQKKYLKKDIKLPFIGTKLEKEFALFLKEDGGRGALLSSYYRKVSVPPSQRI